MTIIIEESLNSSLMRKDLIGPVLQAALDAADPDACVRDCLIRDAGSLSAGRKKYDLNSFENIYLLGSGKAAYAMGRAAESVLADRLSAGALLVKHLPGEGFLSNQNQVLEGDHPIPGQKSLDGTARLVEIARQAGENDLVVFVLSGGASALLTAPREGITLPDLRDLTTMLLSSGADIGEINTLRKHLDAIKGGGLARIAAPAELLVLVLSDVVGSPLDVIGSGPAFGDRSSFADAWQIIEKFNLVKRIPRSIYEALQKGMAGMIPETIRPDDPIMKKVQHVIVGSAEKSAQAACLAAVRLGLEASIITTSMIGEARDKGRELAAILAAKSKEAEGPFCFIAAGETTVTLRGNGIGGRNLELALAAVEPLAGAAGAVLVSLATDGDDGVSGAAGAVVTGETKINAEANGVDPKGFLENNDSLTFFSQVGGLIATGPTGTNVNDLVFLFGGLKA